MAQALPEVPAEVWARLDDDPSYDAGVRCSHAVDYLSEDAARLGEALGVDTLVAVAMIVHTLLERLEMER
jgi:hypothetical protein